MLHTNQSNEHTYLARINRYPRLSREEELDLARRWRDQNDVAARDLLVKGNLRHVVAIARRYKPYKATLDELVAEGSFGLVHALSKFEPERGLRFVTYAAYWIRTFVLTYLLRCRTVVDTGIHSKLLGKVRRERRKLLAQMGESETLDATLATQLGIPREKVRSLLERLDISELSLDTFSEYGLDIDEVLVSPCASAEQLAVSVETSRQLRRVLFRTLQALDVRERYIIEQRVMAHPEEKLSLAEIARRLGISRERARQLELRAKKKTRVALSYLKLPEVFGQMVDERAAS